MEGTLYALLTVVAWGTWLAPSESVRFRNQQVRTFHVTLANLALALLVGGFQGFGPLLDHRVFWLPFLGGIIWSLSGVCAFNATHRLGVAKAMGIWAPLNIVVSIVWGMVLFGEFLDMNASRFALSMAAVAVIGGGILLIIYAGHESDKTTGAARREWLLGCLAAVGAGLLWGSYFIPIRISAVSLWVAATPMALGMFAGSTALVVLSRTPVRLEYTGDYLRTLLTGALWGVGNYGSLEMMELLGTGRGFTMAQLCIVVNALVGIYWLRNPIPGSPAARRTLIGIVLVTAAGILLGNLR